MSALVDLLRRLLAPWRGRLGAGGMPRLVATRLPRALLCPRCGDPTRGGQHLDPRLKDSGPFFRINVLLREIRRIALRELAQRGKNGGAQ